MSVVQRVWKCTAHSIFYEVLRLCHWFFQRAKMSVECVMVRLEVQLPCPDVVHNTLRHATKVTEESLGHIEVVVCT